MKQNGYFSIASGSAGNCSLFLCGNTRILIDFGVSVRKVTTALKQLDLSIEQLDGVLITHEHSDHIKGLSTLVKRYNIPIYATYGTKKAILQKIPQAEPQIHPYFAGETFSVGRVDVQSFSTPHDALDSVGYRLRTHTHTFGFATDLGFMPKSIQTLLCSCDTVVLESNHDVHMLRNSCYPYHVQERIVGNQGHLSNVACAECAVELVKHGVKTLILAHLSETNNSPVLALRETTQALAENGLHCEVFVAPVQQMDAPIWWKEKGEQICLASG